jgi:Flp pilus assembly protein TadG
MCGFVRDARAARCREADLLMRRAGLRWDRASAVAVMFAIVAVPILGLAGLAIDYAIWNETYASLSLTASSASLNAAKIAAVADVQNDTNFRTEGATAGTQWFKAELGQGALFANPSAITPTVTITTSNATVTANVTFSGSVHSIFGKLFGRLTYPMNVAAATTIPVTTFLEVVFMLDDSASMSIGATNADMTTLAQNSACDPSNEFIRTAANSTYAQLISNYYGIYQYSWNGANYDGALATPVNSYGLVLKPATYDAGNAIHTAYCNAAAVTGGLCSQVEQCPTNVNGYAAYAGPPCVFACHSDGTKAAGIGTDLWSAARRNGLTLRLDLLKNATNLALQNMVNYNVASINNLSAAVYTFNTTLNPIYPTNCTPKAAGCESGTGFSAAETAVGAPPVAGSGVYTDTGFQPQVAAPSGVNDNTAVEEAMASLAANYVTAAGNGTVSSSPKKVLFLVTDGFEDDPNGAGINGLRQAMPYSMCQAFKTLGFTVYVVYTPYYPVMHEDYLANYIPVVEGTGTNSIAYNLQACASSSSDYISAANQTALNAALVGFLTNALTAPARFTQ